MPRQHSQLARGCTGRSAQTARPAPMLRRSPTRRSSHFRQAVRRFSNAARRSEARAVASRVPRVELAVVRAHVEASWTALCITMLPAARASSLRALTADTSATAARSTPALTRARPSYAALSSIFARSARPSTLRPLRSSPHTHIRAFSSTRRREALPAVAAVRWNSVVLTGSRCHPQASS